MVTDDTSLPAVQPRTLSRGQLARRSGVALETIRYYERSGLLPPPTRHHNGSAAYTTEMVDDLRFIADLRRLGFSLSEVKRLQAHRGNPAVSQTVQSALAATARLRHDFG